MSGESNKKALKSGIWYTIANFMARGVAFITTPIFTRLMAKADVGNYSNFASWLAILTSVITLDLYTSVTLAKFEFKEKINEYISSVLMLGSIVTAACFLFSLPFKGFISERLNLNDLEFYLLFLVPLVSPSLHMLQIKNRLEYKYKLSVSLSLGSTILAAFFGVLCVHFFQNKLTGRLVGNYTPLIILYVILYGYFLSKSHHISTEYWKYGLKISLPLIVHVLSGHLLSSSDRIMITSMCGSEYNALYTVAYTCSMVVSILWTSMNMAWSPWAFEQMDNANYKALKKASRPYLLFFGFVVFCFLLIAPDLLYIMGGKGYASAVWVIPPVMVAFVFQFVYSLYVNIETFNKKQKYIALGTSIAAVLNIVLNYLFIPVYGYVAAAYTTLVGYAVLFLIHFLLVSRMGMGHWYDTRFNIAFVLGFLILMIGVQFLYLNNMIRYIIIAVLLAVSAATCFILRKEIAYLIRHRSAKMLTDRIGQIKGQMSKRN